MPQRGETIRGYVQGMHLLWLQDVARHQLGVRQQLGVGQRQLVTPATIELRYRYNPDVKSLVAMVPAVIPLLLLLIPAMLATLSVVREKDLGSIINFYVTPTTRLEFLLGKQLPYVALGFLNFLLLALLAVTLFRRAPEGGFSDRGRRCAALRRLLHRDRDARLDPDAHPGGGAVRDGRAHPGPRRQFLRPDRPGFLPGGVRSSGRGRFTRPAITSRSPAGPSPRRSVSPACTSRSSPC